MRRYHVPELPNPGTEARAGNMVRIESRRQGLDEFRRWCSAVFRADGRRPRRQVASEEAEAWRHLAGCVTRLRQACLAGPEFRLRDSAAALVQVCAEFAPVPELR